MKQRNQGIIVAVGVTIAVIAYFSYAATPKSIDIKFVDDSDFNSPISVDVPVTINVSITSNEKDRYDDLKIVTTFQSTDPKYLTVYPSEIKLEPVLGIGYHSPEKSVTIQLNSFIQGGQITYPGKMSLFINGKETDHKNITLTARQQ